MRKRSLAMIAALAAWTPATGPCRAAGTLTTAPVDYTLYREGEVKRLEQRYGSWLLTCDEIRRLGQKFCSLRSVARAADGTIVAALTVSTDDRGRPAAVMTVPFGTSLTEGMRLAPVTPKPRGQPSGGTTTLRPTECGGLGCQVAWPIGVGDIGELRAGRAMNLSFRRSANNPPFPSLRLSPAMTTIEGRIDATGFAGALSASMQ